MGLLILFMGGVTKDILAATVFLRRRQNLIPLLSPKSFASKPGPAGAHQRVIASEQRRACCDQRNAGYDRNRNGHQACRDQRHSTSLANDSPHDSSSFTPPPPGGRR